METPLQCLLASGGRCRRIESIASLAVVLLISLSTAPLALAEVVFDAPFLSTAGAELSAGLGAGDFNGDGKIDLVSAASYTNSDELSVNLGLGGGRFAPSVDYGCGLWPSDVAVGDVNGDGKLDIVTANFTADISLLLGNGDGTFGTHVEYATFSGASGDNRFRRIAIADIDGDGRGDVLVTNPVKPVISIFPGKADGTLGPRVDLSIPASSLVLVVSDFNGDGRPDILVSTPQVNVFVYWLMLHTTGFSFSAGALVDPGVPYPSSIGSATAGDLNGDGKMDLAYSEVISGNPSTRPVGVVLGNGDGTFGPAAHFVSVGNVARIVTGEFDGDGKLDVVTAGAPSSSGGTATLLRGHGDGSLDPGRQFAAVNTPTGAAVFDANGDGRDDLALSGHIGSSVGILFGSAAGGFGSPHAFSVGTAAGSFAAPWALAIGDVNHDGIPDLATISGSPDSLDVLLNDGGANFPVLLRSPIESSTEIALDDFDGDGMADLVDANEFLPSGDSDSTVTFRHGNGDGTFGPPSRWFVGRGPVHLEVADMNHDGKRDLVVLTGYAVQGGTFQSWAHAISVALGNGNGTFQPPSIVETGTHTFAFTVGDLDRDGNPDVVAGRIDDDLVQTLLGVGDGSLVPGPSFACNRAGSMALGDLDGDGVLDLAIEHGSGDLLQDSVAVLLGVGNGSFTPLHEMPMRGVHVVVGVADFDQDGHLDLGLKSGGYGLSVWTGDGHANFTSPATDFGLGDGPNNIAVGDLNGDQLPDVVSVNQFLDDVQVLVNRTPIAPTAVLASLVSASADPVHVHLVWQSSLGGVATVLRSDDGSSWRTVGRGSFDGSGLLAFDDAGVVAGTRVGYRLALGATGTVAGETWLEVPRTATLALAGAYPNPSAGDRLVAAFSLPARTPARLEAFDLAGRRVVSRDVTALGVGSHRIDLAAGRRFRPGVYLLRLTQSGREVTARAVVVE